MFAASDSLIVSSFWQGAANNCASIALIKAAFLKYGYKNVFTVKIDNSQYHLTLKDGTELVLSEQERVQAAAYAKFDTAGIYRDLGSETNNVMFQTDLAYACIAKYIQKKGYWLCAEENNKRIPRIKSFEKALKFISHRSFCTDNSYRYLGLKIKDNKIFDFNNPSDIKDQGAILYSDAHAVAVYKSNLDCHGDWVPLSKEKTCFNYFQWFIVLQ